MPGLTNLTALITGAGIGIGFAIANALARQGANVVLNDFDEKAARQAAESIDKEGLGRCVACPGDASDVVFIQHMVDTAVRKFGSVDIAVANAGTTIFGDIFTTTPDAFEKIVNLNLRGLEMLAKQLVIDFSPLGITVNAIAPGATLTERTLDDPTYLPTWSRITPMGRPATVEDIANAALFLLSPASRHVTGQSLVVDGGWTSVGVPPV